MQCIIINLLKEQKMIHQGLNHEIFYNVIYIYIFYNLYMYYGIIVEKNYLLLMQCDELPR